ncbi:hypothetical protein ABB37_02633 [Leptomonas pyrrhocoris]|uniref:Uncharacterized protein n=1 Tax=Leptomonas pyrrhocoris TaxID=157538 RepID=A0A0M9G5Y0_LEPPY|nr:hypothetical protein ABB37_02633 [Leptomonas pyrrhocoris]KPA82869.1 hypothetical protein ABB37_02633 [Leptomonas pyrrhocoris]|eukprot:XP_015661308.1 hypothetical protein ABB37_02633 [Leptomonas pyrrhocoris]
MLRVVGRRLGGRVGKSGSDALLQAGRTAAAAAQAGKGAASTAVRPASVASNEARGLVDVVLPRVDCSLLKHVLSSSSSSSTSTDIPDIARVLRLDYTAQHGLHKKKKASGAAESAAAEMAHPLADILLVNRIHAAVIEDTRQRALKDETDTAGSTNAASPSTTPLLVLVETNLLKEDAEVQQFIIRNALRMHPLPSTVEVQLPASTKSAVTGRPLRATTPPLTVLILGAEQTERVRALAKLPAPPSPVPSSQPMAANGGTASVPPTEESTPAEEADETEEAAEAASTTKDTPAVEQVLSTTPPKPPAPAPVKAVERGKDGRGKRAATLSRTHSQPRKSQQQHQQKKHTAALLRQHAAGKLKKNRLHKGRVARVVHKQTQRHPPSPPKATRPSVPALPPRLLSVDDTTEKLLWASQPGHPIPLSVLAPLIRPVVFEKMCAAALSVSRKSGAGADAPLSLHTVVYRAGTQSSGQTVWLGAVQAAAELAVALSHGASLLPAAITGLVGQRHASLLVEALHSRPGTRSSSSSSRRRSDSKGARAGRGQGGSRHKPSLNAEAATAETPYVYMLIHTSLSPQDAAVLQQELDYQYLQLKNTPAGVELAGISVLTTQDVSPTQLWYVLEHGVAQASTAVHIEAASPSNDVSSAVSRQSYVALARGPVSPEGAELSHTFEEVYRMLTEQPELLHSPRLSSSSSSASTSDVKTGAAGAAKEHGGGVSQRHPDALVSDALRIAALAQVLMQRKEAQLRAEFAAAQQRNAVSADSESVARAAQKVEIKTMVTEAVEEVSVRHEQATAHLVKTLSSMVGQWSLEKLSDTLEAIMRDELKPIMDVLEERLGTAAQGILSSSSSAPPQQQPSSTSTEGADAATTAAGEGPMTTPPTVTEVESSYRAGSSATEALQEGQEEMMKTLEQVLAQLRELSERASALSAAAEMVSTPAKGAKEEETWTLNAQHAVDEERLLQALRELQQQHQVELQQALDALKDDLRSAPSAPSAASAVPPEVIESAVSQAMEAVSLEIRQGIQKNITDQLDSYCEVHRNRQSNGGSSADREPSLPIMPVTSFELEEMLTRTVNFAVRESVGEVEGHIRAAMEAALHDGATNGSAAPSSWGTGAGDGHDSSVVKAALEELWSQVKAEAAEEEAVKLSQHNRQLLRLFRRQQHLQKASNSTAADGTGLTIMAVEEAVRMTMQPFVSQMQAALTAAAAAGAMARSSNTSGPSSSSSSGKEE